MRKGFTLVELLAVIAILGLLIGVSVPTYLAISSNINQSMAETKIQELKAKSEKYSEETGKSVFDVKSLIEAGVLSPDSELGEYKDPVTGRDMSCDIITIQYKNTGYEATITESDECYEEQYLENLFGMVELYIENESGQEVSKNTWLKESKVNVRYRIKPEYQGKGIVSEVSWSGQAPVQCNSTEINTDKCQKYLVETYENGIKNVEVRLQIKITLNESGASFVSNVSAKVLLDLQRPKLVNNVDLNNEINTSGARRVTFELTDNIGSGVSGYAFTKDLSSGSCSRVSYKNATDGIQTDYLMSGFYGICVKDQVGNITNDIELQNSRFEVKEVDTSPPAISFTGNGIDGDHNWKKKFTITATARDNEGVRSAKYCITTSSTCIPDVDASLTSGSTTREFNVEMPDDKNPQTLCGQVTDLAGNMSEVKCSNFYKVDGKLPEQSFAMGEFKKGSGDWYKELKINVTGADEHSGIINGRYCTTSESMCNPNIPFTDSAIAVTMENGASPQTVCANFTDYAGNTSITTCMSNYYKIDGTNPTPNVSVGANTGGSNGWYKDLTVNITGSDDHSGVSDGIYCIEIGSTCTPNTPIPGSNKSVKLNDNSEGQYVCANFIDIAGNRSATECWGPYYVDGTPPVLSGVSNSVSGHNMSVYVNASDAHSKGLTYYYKIAGSGWIPGGGSYTFTGVPSGGYSVDVYVMDQAGNRSTNTLHTEYIECQSQNQIKNIPDYNNWSTCTKACGTGTTTRPYHMDDRNSGLVCYWDKDVDTCNTMDCCSRTERSGEGDWKSCSKPCNGGTQTRDVYYRSAYDHSTPCGTHQDEDSQSCNPVSCCDSQFTKIETSSGSCNGSCGTGSKYVTKSYISTVTGEYCGDAGSYSTSCDTGKSCCTCNKSDIIGEECDNGYWVYTYSCSGSDCSSSSKSYKSDIRCWPGRDHEGLGK